LHKNYKLQKYSVTITISFSDVLYISQALVNGKLIIFIIKKEELFFMMYPKFSGDMPIVSQLSYKTYIVEFKEKYNFVLPKFGNFSEKDVQINLFNFKFVPLNVFSNVN